MNFPTNGSWDVILLFDNERLSYPDTEKTIDVDIPLGRCTTDGQTIDP